MKIGIITFHFVNNFGGALQAYALSKITSKLSEEKTMIIDYRPWFIRFTDCIRILPITRNPKEIFSGIRTFKERIERKNKFNIFIKENFYTSVRYNTQKKLKESPPNCDKFICGSDQIWNPIITLGEFGPYYLNFEKNKNKKISYAASFGTSHIKQKYYSDVKEYLTHFKSISVREQEGAHLIKDVTGLDAKVLIDPTFLLTKEEWIDIANEPINEEPYILVYMMQKNDEVYNCAKQLKELLNLKVIDISRYGFKPEFVDKTYIDIGPKEFIGLFNNATYVCTNSFHGLAFSLILEKDFYIVPSNRFSSRINNLLRIFELDLPKDINEETIKNKSYDREKINVIMNEQREESLKFLKESLFI